jgi:hypothetical protein
VVRSVAFSGDGKLLQLDGDLHHGREDHDEGPLLLAGDELGEQRLHHLGVGEEAVELVQQEQGGAGGVGQGGQGAQRRQRIAGAGVGEGGGGFTGQAQAAGDVPGGHPPVALAGVLDDLALGLIGFARLDPQPGEGGVDVVGQLVGQLHEGRLLILAVEGLLRWRVETRSPGASGPPPRGPWR